MPCSEDGPPLTDYSTIRTDMGIHRIMVLLRAEFAKLQMS